MKHTAIVPCITALILLIVIALAQGWKMSELCSTYDYNAENALINQVNKDNTWAISYQQAMRRGSYSQVDASHSFLYLAYSRSSCVDVYNHNGEFQYAILLPDCQNGSVQIRCVDNFLVVSDKNNTVYVFDGIEEIAHMEYSQATLEGYDFFWFEEQKTLRHTDADFFVETDTFGNVVRKIPLPLPHSSISVPWVTVIVVAVVIHILCFLWYLFFKDRLPH